MKDMVQSIRRELWGRELLVKWNGRTDKDFIEELVSKVTGLETTRRLWVDSEAGEFLISRAIRGSHIDIVTEVAVHQYQETCKDEYLLNYTVYQDNDIKVVLQDTTIYTVTISVVMQD